MYIEDMERGLLMRLGEQEKDNVLEGIVELVKSEKTERCLQDSPAVEAFHN
jgi:hypothetical protein